VEEQTQHLPTSLIRSVRIAVHTKAEVLRRLLVLYFSLAIGGRRPEDLTPPPDEEDRKLLAGRAEFTQIVKMPKVRRKREYPQDLELREVVHDGHAAVEFSHFAPEDLPPPPHALSGVFVLVDGPHGTCTVHLVAMMGVAAAPSPAHGARAGNETTKSTAGVTGECSLHRGRTRAAAVTSSGTVDACEASEPASPPDFRLPGPSTRLPPPSPAPR
jgi:hypothetical protein